METQKAFYYYQNRCIGCRACQTSCMVFNKLDVGMKWREVHDYETQVNGRTVDLHLSAACHHCKEPECKRVCPAGAYTKRADGLVVQDHSKCIGCGKCVAACPYKAPKMNPSSKKAEKCNGCFSLVDQGKVPECVRGCPVQVLKWDELSNLDAIGASKEGFGFKVFKTNPSVRFVAAKKT